jgi:hypothetical protein
MIINKLQALTSLVDKQIDCDASRLAYWLLRHINDQQVSQCFADNVDYFKAKTFSDFEKMNICLYASLMGSKKVAESLFDNNCNPKTNSYLISYAICSKDTEWVKTLVEKWKVNIKLSKYCFNLYAHRTENMDLIQYFENHFTKYQK